jgi:hypothetical protein
MQVGKRMKTRFVPGIHNIHDLLILEGRKKLGLKSGSIECISMARRTHFCEDLISEQDALNDKNVAETLNGCFRRNVPVNLVPHENPHESPQGSRKIFSMFLTNVVESLERKAAELLVGPRSLSYFGMGTNCRCALQ